MSCKVMDGTKIKRKKLNKDQNDEEKHDCLIELPESLLHHILSYITMEDVIRTSVLAKRWRYIWLYVPCLTFSPLKTIKSKEADFITRSLLVHKGPKIQKLSISFIYRKEDALLVDSWIQFALARNVNQLYLDLVRFRSHRPISHRPDYRLPPTIFNCSSLTVLALKWYFIELPAKSRLSSLKTLSFAKVAFDSGDVNDLLSSCPVLEHLSFTECNLGNCSDLIIMNASVKSLKIHRMYSSTSSALEIYAPFIVSLEITDNPEWKYCVIKRTGSLHSASFVSSRCFADFCSRVNTDFSIFKNLDDFCRVKDLRMSSCYIQALSRTKHPIHDFTEERILDFPSFDVISLWIKTMLMKWEFPGIAYILRHSPNIETLIISIDDAAIQERNEDVEDGDYWKLQEPNFVGRLRNLKTVKVCNFLRNINPLETSTKIVFERLQNDMNFLRFLLKNSSALERLIVTTCQDVTFAKSKRMKSKLSFDLMHELLAFPRASQEAAISFS